MILNNVLLKKYIHINDILYFSVRVIVLEICESCGQKKKKKICVKSQPRENPWREPCIYIYAVEKEAILLLWK